MKKIFLILIIVSALIKKNTAQTYRQLFDKKIQQTGSFRPGYSFWSMADTKQGINSEVMVACLTMYKATKDLKYLHEFVIYAKRMMDRRDDYITSTTFIAGLPLVSGPGPDDPDCDVSFGELLTQVDYPAWSRAMDTPDEGCILYPHFMDTGGNVYPLAQFVLLLLDDNSLRLINLPTEAASSNITTFGGFADWLEANIYQSLDWQIANDWSKNRFGCSPSLAFVSKIDGWRGINQQCAMGRSLVLMYEVANRKYSLNPSYYSQKKNEYISKIDAIAQALWMDVQCSSTGNSYVGPSPGLPWYTWRHGWYGESFCQDVLIEDIAHAPLDEEFAELCYKYLPTQIDTPFGESDMQKFANGFAYRMVPQPLIVKMNVFGSNIDCDQKCNTTNANIRENYHICGGYSILSQYNKQIYQGISDFFVPDNNNYFADQDATITLKTYAGLALHENLFNPIAAWGGGNRSGYPYESVATWRNSTSGDFNNDGSDEFAAMNSNSSGQLCIYYLSSNNVITSLANKMPADYTDLAGGNFDANNPGDEVAVFSSSTNTLTLLKVNNGNIITPSWYFTPPAPIVSVSSGDFNNDGIDELVLLSNSMVYIYQILSGNFPNLINHFPVAGFSKVTVGKFEGGTTYEFALLKTTGEIRVYKSVGGNIYNNIYTAQAPTGTYPNMVAGDYDGDGISELMTYQNEDGTFRIFKVRNGVLSYIPNAKNEEVFPTNQQHGVMCSVRLSNYSDKDALVTFRNYDGQVNVFTMDGFCPGLYLNNEVINSDDFLNNGNGGNSNNGSGNNYPLDYHVNNTLSANNYTIEPLYKVDFTAGNKIVLKPNFVAKAGSTFHAYISPDLFCSNNGNFRTNSANQPSRKSEEQTQVKEVIKAQNLIDNKMLVSVFPNPGNGSYTVRTELDGEYNLEVYNIYGSLIKNISFSGTEKQVDITNFSAGIYSFVVKIKGGLSKSVKVIKE